MPTLYQYIATGEQLMDTVITMWRRLQRAMVYSAAKERLSTDLVEVRLRWRVLAAIAIGIVSMCVCWYMRMQQHVSGPGDFFWALRAANDLLHGRDPYNYPFNAQSIPYPLPAAFFGFPFLLVSPELAGPLFFGMSSGILAFGLTRNGFVRLMIFLSSPYALAAMVIQWSPLIMAAAFFTFLWPLVLVKPQIALPVGLTHPSWIGAGLATVLLALSFILLPDWPLRWISQLGPYERFIPLLTLIGPLLLLALLRSRQQSAQLLLLAAILPQRALYDAFILWLIPRTRIEILATVVASWVIFALPFKLPEAYIVGFSCYLPMLAVLLLRRQSASLVPVGESHLDTSESI